MCLTHFAYLNASHFSQPRYRRRAKGCRQGPLGSGRWSEGWKCHRFITVPCINRIARSKFDAVEFQTEKNFTVFIFACRGFIRNIRKSAPFEIFPLYSIYQKWFISSATEWIQKSLCHALLLHVFDILRGAQSKMVFIVVMPLITICPTAPDT